MTSVLTVPQFKDTLRNYADVQLWAATIALEAHVSVQSDGLYAPHSCIQCAILSDRVKVWRIKRDYPGEVS